MNSCQLVKERNTKRQIYHPRGCLWDPSWKPSRLKSRCGLRKRVEGRWIAPFLLSAPCSHHSGHQWAKTQQCLQAPPPTSTSLCAQFRAERCHGDSGTSRKNQAIPLAVKPVKILIVSLELGSPAFHLGVEFYGIGKSILSHSAMIRFHQDAPKDTTGSWSSLPEPCRHTAVLIWALTFPKSQNKCQILSGTTLYSLTIEPQGKWGHLSYRQWIFIYWVAVLGKA